ncbi:HAD family hydrolase [Streptococcus massiliensis]|uniref:Putative hydrolase n=1 Tax=Streptococcus massiliensis TaxID=313439 RepID=A0A380L1S8_9STRE|nr:HAD family hydrolase [Streptococcus massiliensis]SUN77398.1 putative hydrolase [Streptococcus massiliensis]
MTGKIIFLDVDGTLVDYEGQIPASAVEAVQQARKNGHLVYVCTGRSRAEMPQDIWDIGLDGMIGGNGSYVEHHGEVVMHQLIPLEVEKRVVDWLQARGLEFYLESNNGLFASRNFREAARPVMRMYAKGKGLSEEEAKKLEAEDALHGLVYGGELYRDDLNKISFILNSYQDHVDSKAAFPELKAGTWGGRGEHALFGDLGVKDITKAHAIEVLLEHLGAKQADTIAFGDAKIDIPMLDYCAVGVAMGNGGAEILAMADMITDDVEADGLYHAFEKLGLI